MDLIEESFVVAEPSQVMARLREPERWRRWWPDLTLEVFQDRGDEGLRWTVTGALVGSMEVWLEPFGDGVIIHHYLRADGPTGRSGLRQARRRARHAKRLFWALKDEFERDRRPGEPRTPTQEGAA